MFDTLLTKTLRPILVKATRSELEDLAEALNYAEPWGAKNKTVLIDWIIDQLDPEEEVAA